jgi:BACON domain-containing protein
MCLPCEIAPRPSLPRTRGRERFRAIILPELAKRFLLLTVGAMLALGFSWPAFAAGAHPDAPPQAGEGKTHGFHHISKLDAAIGAPPRPSPPSGGGRTRVGPNVITGGQWTPLGPTPVADEKNIGPTAQTTSDFGRTSGRITSLATDPVNPNIIYLGAAGGGVWKSADGGASWSTSTDSQPSIAIGSLAVDAAGTTIYAATGEDNASGDSQRGLGILKSVNSGVTWTAVGQAAFAQARIGGIVVDRNTSGAAERVFAATDGGLFVSTNSGATWGQVVLPITPIVGKTPSQRVMQVLQDSTGRFWLAVSDFCQTELGSVMTSTDGTTWTTRFAAPSPGAGRIALGISPSGTVAYAALATCANFGDVLGIWKTVDSAASWTPTAAPPQYFSFPNLTPLQSQGWYDTAVAVDPTNSNNAVFGGVTVIATGDGGAHFSDIGQAYLGGVVHPDFHALVFAGANSFYAGNDGGIWQGTETLGSGSVSASWTNLNANLGTIQFYRGAALDTSHVFGGSQDNGSPGIFPGSPAVAPGWQEYLDGDGGYSAIDPTAGSTTIYASISSGAIYKGSYAPPASPDPYWPYDTFSEADPCPASGGYTACSDPVAFIPPTLMDPSNPARLLTARTMVYQSTTGGLPAGSSWSAISPSLATAPPPAGGTDVIASMTMGNTPATAATVWTGSYFGAVWRSSNATNSAATWTNATGNLPAFSLTAHVPGDAWISGVAVNPTNTSEAWATIGAIGVGHVWHTTDGGTSWTDISGTGATGVPDAVVNDIILDRSDNSTLYLATDFGVLTCATCSGSTPAPAWAALGTGLPNVKVDAITQTQQANQVVAWTHGRGAWVVPTAPVLSVSPSTMTFTVGPGGAKPPTQTATVTNQGLGTLTWAQTSNATWLSAMPPSGTNGAGASSQVTVTANPSGLTAGTYNGTLRFTSNAGSATITVALIVPVFPGQYKPLVPARILDTRDGTGGFFAPVGPNQSIAVQVAGQGGVPQMATAAPPSAVVLNVTVTNPTAGSYLTVYPTGVSRPTASNLNFVAHQTVPNLVEVSLGPDGKVNVYNAFGNVDVVFDVQGWVTTQGTVSGTDGLFRPLVPARILDTRFGTGTSGVVAPLGPGATTHLKVAGNGGVPGATSTPPEAVVMNVTVTNPSAPSYLTVFPTGASKPVVSNLNFVAGQTVPNRIEIKLGTGGQVDIFNAAGSVDVIADVNGWFTDGTDLTATGGATTGLTPYRVLDTRFGTGAPQTPVAPGATIYLQVSGSGGVPAMGSAVPPTAVILNVTVTNATGASDLRLFPSDASPQPPNASDLNFVAGQTVPNLVVVKLGADGKVGIYNSGGQTDVIADVLGWYN